MVALSDECNYQVYTNTMIQVNDSGKKYTEMRRSNVLLDMCDLIQATTYSSSLLCFMLGFLLHVLFVNVAKGYQDIKQCFCQHINSKQSAPSLRVLSSVMAYLKWQ